jgi:hypothetical protein
LFPASSRFRASSVAGEHAGPMRRWIDCVSIL